MLSSTPGQANRSVQNGVWEHQMCHELLGMLLGPAVYRLCPIHASLS